MDNTQTDQHNARIVDIFGESLAPYSLHKIVQYLDLKDLFKQEKDDNKQRDMVVITQVSSPSYIYTSKIFYRLDDVKAAIKAKLKNAQVTERLCHDMMKECGNIFAGNIRNVLVAHQLQGKLSMPLLLHGMDLSFDQANVFAFESSSFYRSGDFSLRFRHGVQVFVANILPIMAQIAPPSLVESDSTVDFL